MKRVAIYLRISKDDARTGLAVDRQRAECLAFVERKGFEVVGEYIDNGVSAYARNVKRPGYDRLVADYVAGNFDAVCCWDIDRLTRQPKQLERWIELGEARGLIILTTTEETDLGTDNGRLFARIKAAVARSELERKSARQKAQAEQARAAGRAPVGLRPFGFEQDGVTVRESEAMWLREVYAMVLRGKSVRACVRRLNEAGVTSRLGNPWQSITLKRALERPRNRSRILSADEFDRATSVLAARRTDRGRPPTRAWLSGLLTCGVCGSKMHAHHDVYLCSKKANAPGVEADTKHMAVTARIAEEKVRREIFAELATRPRAADKVDTSDLRAERAKTAEARRKVQLLAEDEDADMEFVKARLSALSRDLNAQDEQIAGAEVANAQVGIFDRIDPTFWLALAAWNDTGGHLSNELQVRSSAFAAQWNAWTAEDRRDLARATLASVKVMPGRGAGRVEVTPRRQ